MGCLQSAFRCCVSSTAIDNDQQCVEEQSNKKPTAISSGQSSKEISPEKTSEEILQELATVGFLNNHKSSPGGVAFSVGNTFPECAPPRRLAKIELSGSAKKREEKIRRKLQAAENRRNMREAEKRAKLRERTELRKSVVTKKREKEKEKKERDEKSRIRHINAERNRKAKEEERKAKIEKKREKEEIAAMNAVIRLS